MESTVIVSVKDLKKYFWVQPTFLERYLAGAATKVTKAVDGVNLLIHKGETLGLVGESGCGKSTLGRVITGLYPPTEGRVDFYGDNMQMIFQNPYSSLNPQHTVGQIIGTALRKRGVTGKRVREETLHLLNRVGLRPGHIDQYPRQFSGGQRQRIGIARALATRPSFIVADEPVSALDVSVQAQILNLLEELKAELGLSYLLISHDLAVVHHLSDRIAIMYLGRIMEMGPTESIFRDPRHPYTQALLSSIPRLGEKRSFSGTTLEQVPTAVSPPPGCKYQSRCHRKISMCESETPGPSRVRHDPGHIVWCHLHEG
ncbi:MAG: ABC transporter ATP-binding protein [Bacillota bacterium]